MDNNLLVTKGESLAGVNWEFGLNRYTQAHSNMYK